MNDSQWGKPLSFRIGACSKTIIFKSGSVAGPVQNPDSGF
jgi:hypothetical protein